MQAEKEGQKGIQESCGNQKTKKSTHKRSPKAKKVKKKKLQKEKFVFRPIIQCHAHRISMGASAELEALFL